ncbi:MULTISPECIES: hypothetical protein [unclassified Aureispira]|uniref:hypothetical protein n=1 Tax=unclassified Aureispira TaxID=2649989 RepID=UPI000697D90C|nr:MULTISPECIES: hypothetical protein [unclassified Aureispira]WMX12008.1 hypothetical protein QP953_14370 [Aureispira sp. CCB-E]
MEENNNETEEKRYLTPEEQLEKIKVSRRLLRTKIKEFIEEETGETYQLEDDLYGIFRALSPAQQQTITGKIALFEKFPNQ